MARVLSSFSLQDEVLQNRRHNVQQSAQAQPGVPLLICLIQHLQAACLVRPWQASAYRLAQSC